MEWILALIGGLGIGSLLTTIVNHFLSKKSGTATRRYQEKREAYLGMAKALYDTEIEPGPKNAKMFGYYLNLAKIFGSHDVVRTAQKVIESAPNSQNRNTALTNFYKAIRKDLEKNS
jgi:hypothetical protein